MTERARSRHARHDDDPVRTPLQSFRVYVPIPFAERIHETISALSASSSLTRGATQAGWIAFFRLGLRAGSLTKVCSEYIEIMRGVRNVLDGAASLDLDPHPCPPKVDPQYWEQQERVRILGLVDELRRAIGSTQRIRMEAARLEREIGVLAREGDTP